jgi:mannose-1-phosphate guanylyltransferase
VFPELIHNKEKFTAFEAPGYWCDAGSSFGYKKAHFDILAGKLRLDLNKVASGLGMHFGKENTVHKTAKIIPPVSIGNRVQIEANAVVGPNVILGNDCVIKDNAFICNSVVGHDSFMGSFSRVINSVLGGPYNVEPNEHIIASIHLENTQYTNPNASGRYINKAGLESGRKIIQKKSKLEEKTVNIIQETRV